MCEDFIKHARIAPCEFGKNYNARLVAYITFMKEMFKKIPQTMIKALTPKQKVQKLMTYIGGGWYMEEKL